MTYTKFLEDCQNKKLASAVVRQIGGWGQFKNYAEDVVNHGASGGFHGFIYYTETTRFFNGNRAVIVQLAEEMAENFGEGVCEMVANFNCLNKNYTVDEVGKALWGERGVGDAYEQIANAMAWFALEEVSRWYVDMLGDEK